MYSFLSKSWRITSEVFQTNHLSCAFTVDLALPFVLCSHSVCAFANLLHSFDRSFYFIIKVLKVLVDSGIVWMWHIRCMIIKVSLKNCSQYHIHVLILNADMHNWLWDPYMDNYVEFIVVIPIHTLQKHCLLTIIFGENPIDLSL